MCRHESFCVSKRVLGILIFLVFAAGVSGRSIADGEIRPPPYVLTKTNGVVIGVTWDAVSVLDVLPKGIKAVENMAGGIVVYETREASVLGPYTAAYFYVNVEGFDDPDGNKANWMLEGIYGPNEVVARALVKHYSVPVRVGSATIEPIEGGRRYSAAIGGAHLLTAEIKAGGCEPATALEHYPGFNRAKNEIVLLSIPQVGQWCAAELKSIDIRPPTGDRFSKFKVKEVKSVGEFRDWSFSFTEPKTIRK